jgi:hypothetical protein
MAYTDIDKPDDYFNTVLYTGTGGTQSITGVGFQPDWVWLKARSSAYSHQLFDVIRGATKLLASEETSAEQTLSGVTSFDSDGFSVGSDAGSNNSGTTFASWNWLANGAGVSNTAGSITSTVSANTTSGFSIVSWTANGSDGATIGHGLGATPNIIISKRRSAIGDWLVGGSTVDTIGGGNNKLLLLNSTSAIDTNSEVYQTIGSSTFQVGDNAYINTSGSTMIAYCFAEKKGFSKFGSYTGNGSTDGPFVYTGFKPAFVMFKRTDSATGGNWVIEDNKRSTFNVVDARLFPNTSDAEVSNGNGKVDFLSNGFKLRVAIDTQNESGGTYIYMAFAENPFVTSTSIPTTAR